jgi:hypothetical protein
MVPSTECTQTIVFIRHMCRELGALAAAQHLEPLAHILRMAELEASQLLAVPEEAQAA